MTKYINTFILVMVSANLLTSQITFNKRFSPGFPAAILSNVIATDSCYFLTGTIADSMPPHRPGGLFLKTDLEGNPQIVKTIRSQTQSFQIWNPDFAILPDGTFAVAARKNDSISKATLVRFDQNGDTLLTHSFTSLHQPPFSTFIWPRAFTPHPDGGFVFASDIQGLPWGGYNHGDIWVVKMNSTGQIEWHNKLGNHWHERPLSLLIDEDNNIIVGGWKANISFVTSGYIYQNYIIKLDNNGTILSSYLSPVSSGLRRGAADMVLLDDGSLVIASGVGHEIAIPSVNGISFENYIFKLNPAHVIEWEITFPEPVRTGAAELNKIIAVSDGSGFVAAGKQGVLQPSLNALSVHGWIGKITPNGDSLWSRLYIGIDQLKNRHNIYGLKETPDGGFILCGDSQNSGTLAPGEIRQQAWLLKLDQYGCLVPGCHITTSAAEPAPERLRLALYPNPAAEYLNFYLRAPAGVGSELSFRIFDAGGRLLREFPHASPDATYVVSVWDWPAGMYVLQCVSGGQVLAVEQFMKQ
ncbi:MAG: T9SS type A sorting domain-containing protein [Saprospiraceae bacterium]|nr:T9SS type A sorting domain-containing protein [Saprospiraceae bacterium]